MFFLLFKPIRKRPSVLTIRKFAHNKKRKYLILLKITFKNNSFILYFFIEGIKLLLWYFSYILANIPIKKRELI